MTLDRDAARPILKYVMDGYYKQDGGVEKTLDELEGCVRPAPAQTIDRGELIALVRPWHLIGTPADAVQKILALLRPVDGVVLTQSEVSTVMWLVGFYEGYVKYNRSNRVVALAEKLENNNDV